MWSVNIVLNIFVVFVLHISQSQRPSPCPKTFSYEKSGNETYGFITIRPDGPITLITIVADFTLQAQLPTVSIKKYACLINV